MTDVLWPLTVVLALLVGLALGYWFALRQTPSTLAKLTEAQLKALAHRTNERRQRAPSQSAGNRT